MNILINATNISGGGGAQVTDSICRYLDQYPNHRFVVVLSEELNYIVDFLNKVPNIIIEKYSFPSASIKSLINFRDHVLDSFVDKYNIDCVFSVFGPIKWRPRCPHISGFALAHVVMPESPFFTTMPFTERLKWRFHIALWKYIFSKSGDVFITENPLITERLKHKLKGKKVVTITNNYNQVFDLPDKQIEKKLPDFDGVSLLDVTAFGPHKNVTIALEIAKILKKEHPDFKFRFVFTFEQEKYPHIPEYLKDCFLFIGKVNIAECPSLYSQCDIAFQPTLLECFTATFPEAMRMGKPLIACDLEFVRGLCGESAIYFKPLSAESAAENIYKLSNDADLKSRLVKLGKKQLAIFDTSQQRADKVIELCEALVSLRNK